MKAKELAQKIADFALEKKGQQIVIMDVHKISSVTDYFVVASADSDVQLKAIADNIERKLRKEDGVHIYHKEGIDSPHWILLDYVDVVVHLFRKEKREYYGLERLWGDAKMTFVREQVA